MIYVVPVLLIVLILYSVYKGCDTYSSFVKGSREAVSLVVSIMPYIFAVFFMISLLRVSGLDMVIVGVLEPVCKVLGIPKEVISILFIKHFSGSGSLAMLEDVYTMYGVDSYISRVASCIVGSSEAVFYITAVYFAKTKVVKFRYGIFICIACSIVGAIFASFICKYI